MPAGLLRSIPPWLPVRRLLVLSVVAVATVGAYRLGSRTESPTDALRRRLLFGVPVGTALTVAGIVGVYLALQADVANPRDALVLPFRAWSYEYPLGIATASFAHNGLGHLVSNAVATVAFGTVAEYAWGHFPERRGAASFDGLAANPYARVLAVPGAALVLGLFLALFSLGPVIGFSGVVFAIAGVAIVHRPILATLAIPGAGILRRIVATLLGPQTTYRPIARVVAPWWADVAIQTHAIGLLSGLLLGATLARAREDWPDPGRFWFALLAFAFAQGLWAVYLPADGGRFVLYRWAGVAVVFAFATVIVAGLARGFAWRRAAALVDARSVAAAVVVVALATLSLTGAVYNVSPAGAEPPPGETLDVRDYRVGYAEDVPNEYVGSVSVPLLDGPTEVTTGGVIVTNAPRTIWRVVVPTARLANAGRASVLVGRLGWRVSGNASVYSVRLDAPDREPAVAYRTNGSRAAPVVAGRTVVLRPTRNGTELVVTRDGERLGSAAVPESGETVTAGGLTFERDGRALLAVRGDTRVRIARRSS